MKRILIYTVFIIILLTGCAKKQNQEMDVFSSNIEKNSSETSMSLTIVLNQKISSKNHKKYAQSIITHCKKNNFKSTQFSYDLYGYPSTLDVTVYEREEDIRKNNICFAFEYYPKDKNIPSKYTIDNTSENYTLDIKR